MLDTPCSEVVWRVPATHSIRQFPLHFPSRASRCAITFQPDSFNMAWIMYSFAINVSYRRICVRLRLKCDGTRTGSRFRLSAKRTNPFKLARGQFSRLLAAELCAISGSNAGYTMFRGSVKGTGYPLHSSVSPSLPLPCVTVWHHISTGLYDITYVNFLSI